jgi:hypothetical protein
MFPGLVHLRRGRDRPRTAVRLRRTAAGPVPLLTPRQVEAIAGGCARWDPASGQWSGPVRDRLLFAALGETGMRLGEVLSTRHCDWHAGRGGTPFIEVIPRQDHPAGVRCKSGRYRQIYISDELERLHSEYVWQLCEADAHRLVDLPSHFVFVNLHRGNWLAPLRPETVYDQTAALKRELGNAATADWAPHWFRHTHASAFQRRRPGRRRAALPRPSLTRNEHAVCSDPCHHRRTGIPGHGQDRPRRPGTRHGAPRHARPAPARPPHRPVLPNGYCLLPPVRSCDKGNACHGCDHFATDPSYLPEISRQLAATEQLIEHRKTQHLARYGEPMTDTNIWLEQRLTETRSMRPEIIALEALSDDKVIVRGPGVCGRSGDQDGNPVTISSKPGTP